MSTNLYDDIDFCLNMLYESIYDNKSDECYSFNTINKKDIAIDDIRKEDNLLGVIACQHHCSKKH